MERRTRAGALFGLVLAVSLAAGLPALAETPGSTIVLVSAVSRAAGADPAVAVLDASAQVYAVESPDGVRLGATRPSGRSDWDEDYGTNLIAYGPGWHEVPGSDAWVNDWVPIDPAVADAWLADELLGAWDLTWGERSLAVDGSIGFVPAAERRYPELDAASEAAFLAARGAPAGGSLSLALAASAEAIGAGRVDLLILDREADWDVYATLTSGSAFAPITLETPIPAGAVLVLSARAGLPSAHGPETVIHSVKASTVYGLPEVAP